MSGHNVVTEADANPVVACLGRLGHSLGHSFFEATLAASRAAAELDRLGYDTAALVAAYHRHYEGMTA